MALLANLFSLSLSFIACISTELDSQIYRNFISTIKTYIYFNPKKDLQESEHGATAKNWGARASEHSFKFCEQIE